MNLIRFLLFDILFLAFCIDAKASAAPVLVAALTVFPFVVKAIPTPLTTLVILNNPYVDKVPLAISASEKVTTTFMVDWAGPSLSKRSDFAGTEQTDAAASDTENQRIYSTEDNNATNDGSITGRTIAAVVVCTSELTPDLFVLRNAPLYLSVASLLPPTDRSTPSGQPAY
ncbi:hypothetical protein C0995_000330 [Termitomyces sp. Mi166|nr:hypothetical protein C0995_000330 [Termitomyces sp. Mi166\